MSAFATQTEARQFFVDQIVQQAKREGVTLSDDERQMLFWSESAPDSVADSALAERLSVKYPTLNESKIVGLLKSSFKEDRAHDPSAKEAP